MFLNYAVILTLVVKKCSNPFRAVTFNETSGECRMYELEDVTSLCADSGFFDACADVTFSTRLSEGILRCIVYK